MRIRPARIRDPDSGPSGSAFRTRDPVRIRTASKLTRETDTRSVHCVTLPSPLDISWKRKEVETKSTITWCNVKYIANMLRSAAAL